MMSSLKKILIVIKRTMMNKVPGMLTCRQLEKFIVDYFDGSLSKGEELKFNAHLKLCADCRQYMDDYRGVINASKDAMAPPDLVDCEEMPESLVKAIMAASKKL